MAAFARSSFVFCFRGARSPWGFGLNAFGGVRALGWSACLPQDFGQIAGQSGRRLQPGLEPARQVGHAVGSGKPQPLGQLASVASV